MNDERKMKIGERIQRERKKLKMSQEMFGEELAKSMGADTAVAQNTVSNWENGRNLPDMDTILSISKFLGCDCGYLLCDYEERTHDSRAICKDTGLSEKTVNTLCSLNSWGVGKELTSVIDALVFDLNFATKGESFSPVVYLLYWFLRFKGAGKIDKQVHMSGEIIDCNDKNGHLASMIKLNDRVIESAVLVELQQALISMKKRLSKRERVK